jgi:hypothetical protein
MDALAVSADRVARRSIVDLLEHYRLLDKVAVLAADTEVDEACDFETPAAQT